MLILGSDSEVKRGCCAVTVGKFDGLHIGHMSIIDTMLENSSDKPMSKMLVSFLNHPDMVLGRDYKGSLMSESEKTDLLYEKGLDYYCSLVFDRMLMNTEAGVFFDKFIVKKWKTAALFVGDDFCFGKGRLGNTDFLKEKCKEKGIELTIIKRKEFEGEAISSSRIRKCLAEGEVERAEYMLGRPYTIKGIVSRGHAIGRTISFPTINIHPHKNKFLPRFGVYGASVTIEGIKYRAIANIGIKPTLMNESGPIAEAHILDFDGDLYDTFQEIRLESFIRPEIRFNSLDELKNQLEKDKKWWTNHN